MLYYKEGERLSELSNYVREWEDQLVEVQSCFSHKDCAAAIIYVSIWLQRRRLFGGIGCIVTG